MQNELNPQWLSLFMWFSRSYVGIISFFIRQPYQCLRCISKHRRGGILLSVNDILKSHWPFILIGLVVVLIGGWLFFKSKYGNYVKEIFGKIIPPIRKLRNMTAMERFTRTTAVLIASGVDLPTVLELAGQVSQSPSLEHAVQISISQIKAGESIHVALAQQKVFPAIVVSMVATGEETGKLDEVMFKVADFYHTQVQSSLKKLVSLVEPIMIMFIGGFIGFLAYTMYNTIFAMEQSIG